MLVLIAAGGWYYWNHRSPAARRHTSASPAAQPVPPSPLPPSATAVSPSSASGSAAPASSPPSSAPCWSPAGLEPDALSRSRHATFATVEQILRLDGTPAPRNGGSRFYRVEAHLLSYRLEPDRAYLLQLGSLVNPRLSISARIPAGRCVANEEEGALFDELREDLDLQFGQASLTPTVLSKPVQILVTAPVAFVHGGVALEPVLNFRVQ